MVYWVHTLKPEFIDQIIELKKYIEEIIKEKEVDYGIGEKSKFYQFEPTDENLDFVELLHKIPTEIVLHQDILNSFYVLACEYYPNKIFEVMDFIVQRGFQFCYHHLFLFDSHFNSNVPRELQNKINKKIMSIGLTSPLSSSEESTHHGEGCICNTSMKDESGSLGCYSVLECLGKEIENFEFSKNSYKHFVETLYLFRELGIPMVEELGSYYPISRLKSLLLGEYIHRKNNSIKICFDAVNDVCGYNELIEQALVKLESSPAVDEKLVEESEVKNNLLYIDTEWDNKTNNLIVFNEDNLSEEFVNEIKSILKNSTEEEINKLRETIVTYICDNCIEINKKYKIDFDLLNNMDLIYWYETTDVNEIEISDDAKNDGINIKEKLESLKEHGYHMMYVIARAKICDKYVYFNVNDYYNEHEDKISIDYIITHSLSDLLKYVVNIDVIKKILN